MTSYSVCKDITKFHRLNSSWVEEQLKLTGAYEKQEFSKVVDLIERQDTKPSCQCGFQRKEGKLLFTVSGESVDGTNLFDLISSLEVSQEMSFDGASALPRDEHRLQEICVPMVEYTGPELEVLTIVVNKMLLRGDINSKCEAWRSLLNCPVIKVRRDGETLNLYGYNNNVIAHSLSIGNITVYEQVYW